MTLNPGNVYAAALFLKVICDGDNANIDDLLALTDVAEDRKARVLTDLVRVGAIDKVNDQWTATTQGHEVNSHFQERHL